MAIVVMPPPAEQPPRYSSSSASSSSTGLDSYISEDYSTHLTPCPRYSPTANGTELVLDAQGQSEATSSSGHEFVYRSNNITINLGPNHLGTKNPVFSNHAVIEGHVTLTGDLKGISSVSLKLEGKITNEFTERQLTAQIACVTTTILPSSSGVWSSSLPFAIPFPEYALGRQSRLPASLKTVQPLATSEVKYSLKATVVRKGLRRNNTLKIPLTYLPRSFARGPALPSIPEPVVNLASSSITSLDSDHVQVIALPASWRGDSATSSAVKDPQPNVFLTLPSALSFAFEEPIPLRLSVVSPQAPAMTKLLIPSIRVQLVKRTRLWMKNGKLGNANDYLIGNADKLNVNESHEGVASLVCELRSLAGLSSRVASWSVADIAEQQYFIRVLVHPPSSTAAHVPSFEFEQQIELCTDDFESAAYDVLALDGTPLSMGSLALPPSVHVNDLERRI